MDRVHKVARQGAVLMYLFMYLFEVLVACLQAYIFAILTTAYINMSYPEID